MMKCSKCGEKAVFADPIHCRKHFIAYFEKKTLDTIRKFGLIRKSDKIAVACSGGKDSTALLYILHKNKYDVTAIAIDEGIKGYRDKTLSDLEKFCRKEKIKLKVFSYGKDFHKTLDKLVKNSELKPCNICGTLRRNLLNKYAKGYDVIATGHNLDDEAQAVMMNFLRNNLELSARLGPKTGLVQDKKFIQRVKPLYFLSEKEVMAYALLKGFDVSFNECPYATESYRARVRDFLNTMEERRPGTKRNIINNFIKVLPEIKRHYSTEQRPKECVHCGEPSKQDICRACMILHSKR